MASRERPTARYPSRTIITWAASWAVDAPEYPQYPSRYPLPSAAEWLRVYREWIDQSERWHQWWRDRRASLPVPTGADAWQECRCAWCGAHLADAHPATRGVGTFTPDIGLRSIGFHHETPFAILVAGLTRELDSTGRPRRDALGRPCFGPPRRRRFRRGMAPSSDGIPMPFMRHAKSPVLIHCPGCGRGNEVAEPRLNA